MCVKRCSFIHSPGWKFISVKRCHVNIGLFKEPSSELVSSRWHSRRLIQLLLRWLPGHQHRLVCHAAEVKQEGETQCACLKGKLWLCCLCVTYLETLLPQEILEAWFFSLVYACCEEGIGGGELGADRDLSRLSWDDSVFWRDFQFS